MSHIKIKKLLFTGLKTKHKAFVIRDHVIQFFTLRYWRYNIFFKSTYKEVIYALCVFVFDKQEHPITITIIIIIIIIIIKHVFTTIFKVKALLFFI